MYRNAYKRPVSKERGDCARIPRDDGDVQLVIDAIVLIAAMVALATSVGLMFPPM